jgi:hypothetical protein
MVKSDFIKLYEELEDLPVPETEELEESRRIVSDPDALYHYTNPGPLMNIFKTDCLRSDINTQAVCFTTDASYAIYGYPCGLKLSRAALEAAGYTLIPYDEWEGDSDHKGESEERVLGDVKGISGLVTEVIIHWQGESGAWSSRLDPEIAIVNIDGMDYIADSEYDEKGNEGEGLDISLKDFLDFLDRLSASGIKVTEYGTPAVGKYVKSGEGPVRTVPATSYDALKKELERRENETKYSGIDGLLQLLKFIDEE